jgi:hypothetical protein
MTHELRAVLRSTASDATTAQVASALARYGIVAGVHRGLAALGTALGVDVSSWYACRHGAMQLTALQAADVRVTPCWVGVAQAQRLAKDGVSTWVSAPWCPRCGADGASAPVPLADPTTGTLLVLQMAHDIPDGLQIEELLPGELQLDDLHTLPPAVLRAFRRLRQQVVSLESRLAAAGIP